jgi:hypothetical protein
MTPCCSGRASNAFCASRTPVRAVPDADRLLAEVRRERPELVVADIRMPARAGGDSTQAASALRIEDPSFRSRCSPNTSNTQALHAPAGAARLWLPPQGPRAGTRWVPRRTGVGRCRWRSSRPDPFCAPWSVTRYALRASRLAPRHAQCPCAPILALAAEGHTNARIADEVGCAERTAESHTRAVFQKLDLIDDGFTHRRELAVLAFSPRRHGQPLRNCLRRERRGDPASMAEWSPDA